MGTDKVNEVVATWGMGTPETKEVVLYGEKDEDTYLSGNVRFDSDDGKWYVTFYDWEVGMGFEECGYTTRKEAIKCAEDYFEKEGYKVDHSSLMVATAELFESMEE